MNPPPPFPQISQASVPEGERVYAIGDIHGSLQPLASLMQSIRADIARNGDDRARLVFLGDYIDRGLFSKQVIEFLLHDLPQADTIFLRGNHEEIALRFLDGDWNAGALWLKYGGLATLMSYGVMDARLLSAHNHEKLQAEFRARLPSAHEAFLRATQDMYLLGDYCFVHAGVRPGVELHEQSREDMLWIRKEFLETETLQDKIIVHGHNISLEPDIKPNRIGIDTGAYDTGRLTCLVLHGETRGFLHS